MADEKANETTETKPPERLIPSRVYDVLKWVGLIVLPACATFMLTIGQTWGIPYAGEIATTIVAVGTMIGAVIGVSTYNAKGGGADGQD